MIYSHRLRNILSILALRLFTVGCIVFSGWLHAAVINIGAFVHPASLPEIRDHQFILVDFWATWCGPCIQSMDHLGQLQQAGGNNLVVIGLSNEPYEVVKRFFTRREPKTYIAVDASGITFSQFNITALPRAALIAPDGEIIWQGKPTYLSTEKLKELLAEKYTPIPVSEKIIINQPTVPVVTEHYLTKNETKGQGFILSYESFSDEIKHFSTSNDSSTIISGKTSEIIASILAVPKARIHLNAPEQYGTARFDTKLSDFNKLQILEAFLKSQNIQYNTVQHEAEVLTLTATDTSKLWSHEVYEYSDDGSPMILYSDDNLQADNYTLAALACLLSDFMHANIVYKGQDTSIFDWNLDTGNLDALTRQLKEDYGVLLTKTTDNLTDFIFVK